ncbi:hypothetical protein [Prosthecobacter sp.]|uniref:hypothetical protein n=1 Tax=Prosthecobacter sp. TaxID=1965333 RepID=UPI002489B5FD|nr:hypothetical protein [Prosthecobacter sp.]MDI1313805.1 hypothetical protein [Prosthecobacter sp.]
MKLAGAYINDDTYERLVALALSHNRTLAGQCRHLFDRALKGELQVPDFTPGTAPVAGSKPALQAVANPALHAVAAAQSAAKPGTPAAAKPVLRAVARALEALPLAGATRVAEEPPPVAAAEGRQPLAAGAALLACGPPTRPVYENVPVAGRYVAAASGPRVVGETATRGTSPATGLSRPACSAGADAGCPCASLISNHTPTMMKTHTPDAHRRSHPGAAPAPGPCLHENSALPCAHAAGRAAR